MIKMSYTTGEHTLNEEELETLLNSIEDFENYVLIKTAVTTGLRRGDIVRLKWEGVDWSNKKILFYEKKKKRNSEVYVNNDLLTDLRRLYNIQEENQPYLFPGGSEKVRGKGHISSKTAYNRFQYYLDKAGLKQRPFHSLRATCIKLCQKRGWSAEETSKHVGDTIRVIQEHYSTPTDVEMRSVAEKKKII